MRYLLTLWGDENDWETWSEAKLEAEMARWEEIDEQMTRAGALVVGEGLEPTTAATTVRVAEHERTVVDGPFAETKEQLGGFYLLECRDLDEAIEWARRIPVDPPASIEIRPAMDFESGPAAADAGSGGAR